MRIAIMGAGGVGGYFGARLALAGNEVGFVARGEHLSAIQERGLHFESPLGGLHVASPIAIDHPTTLGFMQRKGQARCLYFA
jgi:2-dehydropantoate 2-reductase